MSSSLGACLKKILEERCILPLNGTDDTIKLRDRASGMQVELMLNGSSASITTIRMNTMSHLSRLRQGRWNKICDFLVIAQYRTKSYAIFVELKRTFRDDDVPKEQLRRTAPLWEYLRAVCRVEEQDPLPKTEEIYIAVFENVSDRFNKQPVKVRQYTGERYKGINIKTFNSSPISFSQLIQA